MSFRAETVLSNPFGLLPRLGESRKYDRSFVWHSVSWHDGRRFRWADIRYRGQCTSKTTSGIEYCPTREQNHKNRVG